ncbi:MAG: tRNA (adenosine(37)-N6)-dimethylallyltransferase MiaA [Dehalococcoidales bacterium]
MKRLIAIVGPTAAGKSRLAIDLARAFDGEIVSADSRQVYRYLDIGTAKSPPEELAMVKHHLIDVVNPDDGFSLARYQEMANEAIDDIQRRAKLPLLVGGSGLYVWAVLEGWNIPRVAPDIELRQRLEEMAARDGAEGLCRELARIDPAAAARIDKHNIRRIIRAIEVARGAGEAFSRLKDKQPPSYRSLMIGLTAERTELYRRIDLRVDKMIENGLVAEVRSLIDRGYSLELPAMSGIGYRQIGRHISGELDIEAAVQQIKFENHRFVRRQQNWFKPKDSRIHWLDITDDRMEEKAAALVTGFTGRDM